MYLEQETTLLRDKCKKVHGKQKTVKKGSKKHWEKTESLIIKQIHKLA